MSPVLIGIVYVALMALFAAIVGINSSAPAITWPLLIVLFFMTYALGAMLSKERHAREARAALNAVSEARAVRERRFTPPEPPKGPSAVLPPKVSSRHAYTDAHPEPHPAQAPEPGEDPGLTLSKP